MPNQHSPDKETVSFYVNRTLSRRVRKAAAARSLTLTSFLEEILTHATSNITLTPEDYRIIAQETQRAIDRAAAKGTGRSPAPDGRGRRSKS